jgi:hypothetical protein
MPRTENTEYLGDGVYASHDGFQIWLSVGSHLAEPVIALEPNVLANLIAYYSNYLEPKT